MAKSKNQITRSPYLLVMIGVVLLAIGFFLGSKYQSDNQSQLSQTNQAVVPTHAMSKDDIRRELIDRCGDIPSEQLNLSTGHYAVVDGPYWSPDCRHLAWSVWNSGTGVMNPDGSSGTPVKGSAEEGVFLYTEATGRTMKLTIPNPYDNNTVLQGWKDRDTLALDYNTNTSQGRANFTFDITNNTAQPK